MALFLGCTLIAGWVFVNKCYILTTFGAFASAKQWERRYQEEELSLLRKQMERVSQEVETEIKRLRGREKVMRSICDEQRQVRPTLREL